MANDDEHHKYLEEDISVERVADAVFMLALVLMVVVWAFAAFAIATL